MHLYANDNDDMLPPQAGFPESVMPYLMSRRLSEGFVYELASRNLAGFEEPSRTPLGHFPGRRGRAVVYADGNVRWHGR
jgi:hypothetical protein